MNSSLDPDNVAAEVADFERAYGPFERTGDFRVVAQYPDHLVDEYGRARHHVLWHACRYGLGWECLSEFYRLEQQTPGEHWRNANDALYEWDV